MEVIEDILMFLGLSDPYCVVFTSPTGKPSKYKTKIKKETLEPKWQEHVDMLVIKFLDVILYFLLFTFVF